MGWAVIHVWIQLSSLVHTRALLGIQLKKKNTEKMLVESMETEAYYMLLMEMNVYKFGRLIYFFLILESYWLLNKGRLIKYSQTCIKQNCIKRSLSFP